MDDNENNASFDLEPGSVYVENDDGSWERIGEVPEAAKELAARLGKTILPAHMTAAEVQRLDELRAKQGEGDTPQPTTDRKAPPFLIKKWLS